MQLKDTQTLQDDLRHKEIEALTGSGVSAKMLYGLHTVQKKSMLRKVGIKVIDAGQTRSYTVSYIRNRCDVANDEVTMFRAKHTDAYQSAKKFKMLQLLQVRHRVRSVSVWGHSRCKFKSRRGCHSSLRPLVLPCECAWRHGANVFRPLNIFSRLRLRLSQTIYR